MYIHNIHRLVKKKSYIQCRTYMRRNDDKHFNSAVDIYLKNNEKFSGKVFLREE